MSDILSEIKAREKKEVAGKAEQTKPGPVFTPSVDIFETETALTVLADLPGVTQANLDIDLHEDVLSIVGHIEEDREPGENVLLKEYETGQYIRKFTLSEVIDQEKIRAELVDGVLRLTLPKVEKAKPRKIQLT